MSEETQSEWLDFNEIKESADVRYILSQLGLIDEFKTQGAEVVGHCPFRPEHGKKDSFSFNLEKKVFHCFACKRRGSILDFVSMIQEISVRGSAEYVKKVMERSAAYLKRIKARAAYRQTHPESWYR